jgi:hypothetical protein
MILYRTELASTELNSSKRTLGLLERRLLLFADGQRTIDQIRALVSAPHAGELLYLLEKNGYLTQSKPKASGTEQPAASVYDDIVGQLKPLIAPIAANVLIERTKKLAMGSGFIKPGPRVGPPKPRVNVPEPHADVPSPQRDNSLENDPAVRIDDAQLTAIKRIITETSIEHLGVFSRELLDKTERAENALQLRACISQWHMAMQESRTGREQCLDWLDQVTGLMMAEPAMALKSA